MSGIVPFPGNCPKNVSKDAKYSIGRRKGRVLVGLTYETADDEIWHPTTDAHSRLVEMVSDVKTTYGTSPYGPFYVNEYKHVIVPVGEDGVYYYAGTYAEPLRFKMEDGLIISGESTNLDGRPLHPGDTWMGPHAGIPYVLAATGDDLYY